MQTGKSSCTAKRPRWFHSNRPGMEAGIKPGLSRPTKKPEPFGPGDVEMMDEQQYGWSTQKIPATVR